MITWVQAKGYSCFIKHQTQQETFISHKIKWENLHKDVDLHLAYSLEDLTELGVLQLK